MGIIHAIKERKEYKLKVCESEIKLISSMGDEYSFMMIVNEAGDLMIFDIISKTAV